MKQVSLLFSFARGDGVCASDKSSKPVHESGSVLQGSGTLSHTCLEVDHSRYLYSRQYRHLDDEAENDEDRLLDNS